MSSDLPALEKVYVHLKEGSWQQAKVTCDHSSLRVEMKGVTVSQISIPTAKVKLQVSKAKDLMFRVGSSLRRRPVGVSWSKIREKK